MPDKIKLSQIRADLIGKYPAYADLNDEQLLIGVRKKFYPDIPAKQFYDSVDYDTQRARLTKEAAEEMPWYEKAAAGFGKSYVDTARSGKRLANMAGSGDYDQAAAQEDEARDRPLMDTGWGRAGKFVGDVSAWALPGMRLAKLAGAGTQIAGRALPRMLEGLGKAAAPYVGGATAGAVTGAALAPEDMEQGAKMGAVWGPAGEFGGRVATGVYGGLKAALVDTVTEEGRKRILKRTLDSFARDPQKARAAAQNPQEHVPGYTPTLAEATMDPGLAQLQRSAQTMPPVANVMAEAKTDRLNAYRTQLDDLAGSDGRMTFHKEMREGTANQMYGQAFAGGLPGMTPELQQQFGKLMQRPSVAAAMQEARKLAKEKGIDLAANPGGSVEGLHWMKMALDDQIGAAKRAGADNLVRLLQDTKEEFVAALQQGSPQYGEALATFAQMSRPINQMEIGKRLHNTLFPAMNDMSKDAFRATGNQYSKAVTREGAETARAATGMNNATLENTLDPAQLQSVQGIARDVSRNTRAQELAAIHGSQTAQHMGARNVLRSTLGPLGLPESALDGMIGRVTAGIMSLPFKFTQSQTEELLARVLRDPKVAAAVMATKDDPTHLARLIQPYAAQIGIQLSTE